MRNVIRINLVLVLSVIPSVMAQAQSRTVSRLFWQDDSSLTLKYGDLKRSSDGWSLDAVDVAGFPKFQEGEQSLVQMQASSGLILVGVHDQEEGTIGSGWVAIESGVEEKPHGDHSHWYFDDSPQVLMKLVDTEQGNPAHVYKYGESFVMANDKKNGFTLTSAKQMRDAKTPSSAASFFSGGNGHITLALVDQSVVYATWIAPFGVDSGRVDVVGVGANQGKGYRFCCPTGMLHGATENQGRVFFAPADGVCWVDADKDVERHSETVQVNHLSLGTSGDGKPLRTGAFTTIASYVFCTAGKGVESKLCWIDASAKTPAVSELKMNVAEGHSIMTPIIARTRTGQTLACVFSENVEDPAKDKLLIVNLDPNRDNKFADAKQVSELAIGPNSVVGHSGHHDACVLGDRRHLAITNPGDGSLWVISLSDCSVQSRFHVSGQPTRLISIGG